MLRKEGRESEREEKSCPLACLLLFTSQSAVVDDDVIDLVPQTFPLMYLSMYITVKHTHIQIILP